MQDYFVPPQYDSFGTEFEAHRYYRLAEFAVSGRCACNGHSSSCEGNTWPPPQCACEHSTGGAACDQCLPLFFRGSSTGDDRPGFEDGPCEACECNDLAATCSSDGECLGCANNTAGDSCEFCAAGFYTATLSEPGSDGNDEAHEAGEAAPTAACTWDDIARECGASMTDCLTDLGCAAIIANFQNDAYELTAADMQDGLFKTFFACAAPVCSADDDDDADTGGAGTTAAPAAPAAVCLPCGCNALGTVSDLLGDGIRACNRDGGNCSCIAGVEGRTCDACPSGTFGPLERSVAAAAGAEDGSVCAPCSCADGQTCSADTGECSWNCDDAHTGKACVACSVGWHVVIQGNELSGTPAICKQCDAECGSLGCNAGGSIIESCNSVCANMKNATHCIAGCPNGAFQDASPLLDSTGTCHPCHSECAETCASSGASEHACDYECKNKIFEDTCVPKCPARSYDAGGQYCGTCHAECAGGCVGPTEFDCDTAGCKHVVDDGGCNSACRIGDFAHRMSVTSDAGQVVFVCRRCSEHCDRNAGCHGPSDVDCNLCSDDSFVQIVGETPGLQCVGACDADSYSAPGTIRGGGGAGGGNGGTAAPAENVCLPCNVQCKGGCNGPSAYNCTAGCANANFDGACFEACPPSTYSTIASKGSESEPEVMCHKCDAHCKECDGPGADDCIQCADDAFQEGPFASPDGRCTTECSDGMYGAFGRCIACDAQCKDGCSSSGHRGGACSSCKHLTFGSSCYSECPHMTLASSDNKTCIQCHASCAGGCDGPDDTDCAQCLSVTVDGRCLAGCPKGTFRVASEIPGQADTCAACSGHCDEERGCHGPRPSDCVVCRASTIFYNGACVDSCPRDHYAEVPGNGGRSTCQPCNTVCSQDIDSAAAICSGPSAEQCTKCGGKQSAGGSCVAECPALFWAATNDADNAGGTVGDAVDGGTTSFDGNKLCTACHEECAEGCRAAGAKACKACKHFDHGGKCVQTCPSLMYGDVELKACVECSSLCAAGCFGPDPEHCVGDRTSLEPVCSRNALITEGGLCTSSCDPLTEYRQDRRCLACDEECSDAAGCKGHGPGNCRACKTFELAGACVAACPQGWHAPASLNESSANASDAIDGRDSNADRTCQRCDSQCSSSGCTGPGVEGCRTCRYINANGTCTSSCPPNHFQDFMGCHACNSECANGCVGPLASDCMGCTNWRSQLGVCSSACNLDESFAVSAQKECHACHSQCLVTPGSGGCPTGPRADQCATCRKFSDNGICKDSCSPNQYPRRDPDDLARALSGSCVACHPLCGQKGCVGPNSNDCVADGCQTLSIVEPDAPSGFRCVESCPEGTYEDAASRVCRPCHAECLYGCSSGGGEGDCTSQAAAGMSAIAGGSNSDAAASFTAMALGCRNVAQPFLSGDGARCLETCLSATYKTASGICEACNPACGESGCVGHPDHCRTHPEQQCSKDTDYFDLATLTCRPCNPQCRSAAGGGAACRGGGADMCVECAHAHLGEYCVETCDTASTSQTHYYLEPSTDHCRECHEECAGGCTGPSSADCNECQNYKLAETDVCVAKCETGKEYSAVVATKLGNGVYVDVAVCYPCNPLLGPGPSDCSVCGLVTNGKGKCKTACDSPEVAGEGGVCMCPTEAGAFFNNQGDCKPCHVQCKATVGCTSYNPIHCVGDPETGNHGCKNVQRADGRCVEACLDLEKPNPETNICECDLLVAFVDDISAQCVACHAECTEGCVGPSNADCLNTPGAGCLHVYFPAAASVAGQDFHGGNSTTAESSSSSSSMAAVLAPAGAGGEDRSVGRCVPTCDHAAGFVPGGPDRVCSCNADHFETVAGECRRCSTACRNGCVGPFETNCTECAAFLVDGECTDKCPRGTVGDYITRTCGQCHAECGANGCSVPNDASMCTRKLGHSTCASVMDNDGCAAACPGERPYMVKEVVANPTDGNVGTFLTCTSWCPSGQPYFNDPRNATEVVDGLNITQIRANGTSSETVDYGACRDWEYEAGIEQRCGGYSSYAALVDAHSAGSQWHSIPALGRVCGASCGSIVDGAGIALVQNNAFPNELRCSLPGVANAEAIASAMMMDASDRSAQLETKDIYVIAVACAGALILFFIYYLVKQKGARHKDMQKSMVVHAPHLQQQQQYISMLGPGMPPTPRDITDSPSYVNPYSAYKNIQTPAALGRHSHQHPYGRPGASMVDSPSYMDPYAGYRNVQTPMAMSQLRTGGGGGGSGGGGGVGGGRAPPSRLRQGAPPRLLLEGGGSSAVPPTPGSPLGGAAGSVTSSEL